MRAWLVRQHDDDIPEGAIYKFDLLELLWINVMGSWIVATGFFEAIG